jgi:hypothetical protein
MEFGRTQTLQMSEKKVALQFRLDPRPAGPLRSSKKGAFIAEQIRQRDHSLRFLG